MDFKTSEYRVLNPSRVYGVEVGYGLLIAVAVGSTAGGVAVGISVAVGSLVGVGVNVTIANWVAESVEATTG
jgi:hypothetical protein